MRNDLSRACVHCMLRLPEACVDCPRCGLPTKAPRMAVGRLGRALRSESPRPLRDALLYVPAAALIVAVVAAAVYGTRRFIVAIDFDGGLLVAGALVAFATCLTCAGTAAAILWGPWAGAVLLADRFMTGKPGEVVLRTAPLGASREPSAGGEAWLERVWRSMRRWLTVRNVVIWIVAVELCAEIFFTRHPFGRNTVEGISITVGALLFQAVAGFILGMPIPLFGRVCVHVERKLRSLFGRRATERGLESITRDLEPLRIDRARVSGAALGAGRMVVAPLSGRRCLGFRLVGRIGCMEIDDAEMGDLLVRGSEDEVAVRGRSAMLALPEPTASQRALDPEQMRRVVDFLAARTMDLDGVIALGETILEEGTEIAAHGAESQEPAPGATYRTAATRRVLSDTDGRPVLVRGGDTI